MSSIEGRQLQRRLDLPAETSAFAARPAFIWAFQISQKQLQAIVIQRPSLLHPTAAQVRAFVLQFGAKQRQSLLTCSRLPATLATRLLWFGGQCSVEYPLRKAACILSRRHKLSGRLGAVAAVGAGFVCVIGSRCDSSRHDADGQLCGPKGGVAFDNEGNLVVCDSGNARIQVFRYRDGTHLRTFGRYGLFSEPWGVAFDGAGHIVVADSSGHRVQVLRYSDGAHVRNINSVRDSGELSYASGIAVDSEGNVAVYDCWNARVQVFQIRDGAPIRTFGSKGSDNGQFGIGHCGLAFDSEGNIVVADCGNNRVQVLRYPDGMHIRTIGSYGQGAGQFDRPSGVAFDAAGHIVVVETGNNRVQVMRYSDGAHVRTIGSQGSGDGQLNQPYGGIVVDSDGRIVVADTGNHRVQVLQ